MVKGLHLAVRRDSFIFAAPFHIWCFITIASPHNIFDLISNLNLISNDVQRIVNYKRYFSFMRRKVNVAYAYAT